MPIGDTYQTGDINPESAVYQCQGCMTQKIPLTKGEPFPPCNNPTCKGKEATWKNIESLK